MGLTGPEKTDPSKYNDARFGGLILIREKYDTNMPLIWGDVH